MVEPSSGAPPELDDWLREFLAEDRGVQDVTTEFVVPEHMRARAELVAKAEGVLSGFDVAARLFVLCDEHARVEARCREGDRLAPGTCLGTVAGDAAALLAAERTALNLLQRMSGIATLTARFVDAVKGTGAQILETRKTAPGLRWFDKRAVRAGGGANHRQGLHDQVLIKENHIATLPTRGGRRPIEEAVARALSRRPPGMLVEVEVWNREEAERAVRAGADIVLLDNFSVEEVRATVEALQDAPRVLLEASGRIHLGNVRQYAETGVHRISVGALTHSAPALDVSMLFRPEPGTPAPPSPKP